ncbi:MAG: hypothetical protein Q8S20_15695 [Sulfuritalea sp.]|nr:hypothetical protein [Sulfuritalea sp.]
MNELPLYLAVSLARDLIQMGLASSAAAMAGAKAHRLADAAAVQALAVQAEDDLAAWRANLPVETASITEKETTS